MMATKLKPANAETVDAWRPALLAFYWRESPWMRQKLENLERGDPFTEDDLRVIEGLRAAVKVAA